jgi:hypothetical protein
VKNIIIINDNLVIRHVVMRYINTYSPVAERYGFYSSDARTFGLANKSDVVIERTVASSLLKCISLYAYWFFLDLAIGANLFVFNLYIKPTFDINIEQAKSDLLKYRVKYTVP